LVVSEVLTNGCLYGGGRVRVRARISRQSITVKVSTPAPWRDRQAQLSDVEDENGRGLEIARALAESVHIAPDAESTGVSVTVVCLAAPARGTAGASAGEI
jgi:anti-sigma regulatory factor (Ser/Thr protein kinase)